MADILNEPDETGVISIKCIKAPKVAVWHHTTRQIHFDLHYEISNTSLEFEQLRVEVSSEGFPSKIYIETYRYSDFGSSINLRLNHLVAKDSYSEPILDETPAKFVINIIADGEMIDREEVMVRILPSVSINTNIASVYSVIFHQNQIPLISNLELTNNSDEDYDILSVRAEFDPGDFDDAVWNIEQLSTGQTIQLNERSLKLSADALSSLKESRIVSLKISLSDSEGVIASSVNEVELLPKYQWGGEMNMPELLAAFITPNTYYTDSLLKKASNMLSEEGHESRIDGYQSNTRDRPYMMAAALWAAVTNEGISYSVPPASFARGGQKIRTTSEISKTLLATCLDTALLFASCLEQAGLNPLVALTKRHALVGCWLIEDSFPNVTNDDASDLRNRIALKDIILFETTLATSDRPVKFDQAIREGNRRVSEDLDDEFVYVIDVKQARSRKINPIDTLQDDAPIQAEGADRGKASLPTPPVLPPVNDYSTEEDELSPDDRVEQWKRKLLDLTKRNKLLNISQRSMGFRIICPDLGKLEDNLASGRKYSVVSKDSLTTEGRSSEQFTLQTGENLTMEVAADQLDRGCLVANCSERDLERDLINLFRRAKSDMEEGGANTLFLTLGMLKWRENEKSEQFHKAPLMLLPIKLSRASARAKPKIMQLPDEGPVFNMTLIELMLQDHEIDLTKFQKNLPKDESGIDVQRVWTEVRAKLVGSPGFEVTEELFLSNFSFAKYLMWKDLSDRIGDLKKSKLVNHLVEKPNQTYGDKADFRDIQEVDKIDPSELFAPLNADSAQIVAIDASAKGSDFVLEGPPGTGKSETISNIIAHNLALGKKVLFVSEKMAALDVVYTRLKKVGLGHVCLELHSNKATKKEVVNQLKDAWAQRESASTVEWLARASELKTTRNKLNAYADELHKVSQFGFTPYQAIARLAGKGPTCLVKLDWGHNLDEAPVTSPDNLKEATQTAKSLGLAYKDIADIDTQAFECVQVADWSFAWQAELIETAGNLVRKTDSLAKSLAQFINEFGLPESKETNYQGAYLWSSLAHWCLVAADNSLAYAIGGDVNAKLKKLQGLADYKEILKDLLSQHNLSLNEDEIGQLKLEQWEKALTWDEVSETANDKLDKALSDLREIGIYTKEMLAETDLKNGQCIEGLTDKGIDSIEPMLSLPLAFFSEIEDGDVRLNSLKRFTTKWKVNGLLKPKGFHKIKTLGDLRQFAKSSRDVLQNKTSALEQNLRVARRLSELHEKIIGLQKGFEGDGLLDKWSTSAEEIIERIETGKEINDDLNQLALQCGHKNEFLESCESLLVSRNGELHNSSLTRAANELLPAYRETVEALNKFESISGSDNKQHETLSDATEALNNIVSHSNELNAWCHWVDARKNAENASLGVLANSLCQGLIKWNETAEQFQTALHVWAAPLLVDASPVLREFSASQHDNYIQEFRELDEKLANTTGQYIAAVLAGGRPDTTGPNAPHEYGVLAREIQRQRGHKPVRQLVSELGGSLLDLTPCFMMSPLSVAQYLPSEFREFDLVVFDEASQITVWDAVGAIARGRNVIVVGDPKQMPPTNFFNRSQDTDDNDEADLESILDQAMAARVSHHRLTGHYRSRHESLIAFSNHKYYQNSLTTYPSAETKASAVVWHKVDGVYARGAERNNPTEAKAVVAEVVRRLRDPVLQKLSIGIVAMNSEQQRLIENLLDEERRADPTLEQFFKDDGSVREPIFVKNLETVQGDQRDVICLSIGYGPTELGAQTMSMQFGPLLRPGGERRLNVAITRASTEMLIFTSFDPSMIDLSRTSAQAVKDLKSYIQYADRGHIALAQEVHINNDGDQFDSEFEEAVARGLREKGWKLKTQVGASKFRIDLGVLHPDEPSSFLAGIECDGATYHSSPSARDRDRVRHIILENLGWTLVRIWSTDFFINAEKVLDRVDSELQALLEEDRENDSEDDIIVTEPIDETTDNPPDLILSEEIENEETESANTQGLINSDSVEGPQTQGFSSETNSSNSLTSNYIEFKGDSMADPRVTPVGDVASGLLLVIETEGPVIAKRAYDVYLRHCGIKRMGKDIRKFMNKAMQSLIRRNLVLKEDEWDKGGLLYSIMRTPEQSAVTLRDKGPRMFEEIPPSEIRDASKQILATEGHREGSEEHFRAVLNLFGYKRLTSNIQESLNSLLTG